MTQNTSQNVTLNNFSVYLFTSAVCSLPLSLSLVQYDSSISSDEMNISG